MYKLLLVPLIFILLLTGCTTSKTNSFQGQIDSINGNVLLVNCSEAVNFGELNVNAIGYYCSVSFTNETIIKDVNGKPVATDELLPGAEVSVLLSKSINLKKELRSNLTAKEITIIQPALKVEHYEMNRSDIIGAKIFLGGNISDSGELVTNIEDEQTLDQLFNILHQSPSFRGNLTSDWNYTIVLTLSNGNTNIIEVVGTVNVFTDRSIPQSYKLDKEKFLEFINSFN